MNDKEFYKLANQIIRVAFPNGESDFEKVLWRMSSGCRQEAFYILKLVCARYNICLTDDMFEYVVGEINGGIDVDWITWDWEEIPEGDSYAKHRRDQKIAKLEKIDNELGNGSVV